jgi:transposase
VIQAPELTGVMMSNLFWLTNEQIERLKPFFPKSHGKPSVDDRSVLSGIIFINRNGLR